MVGKGFVVIVIAEGDGGDDSNDSNDEKVSTLTMP